MADKARLAAVRVLAKVLPANGNGRSLRDAIQQEKVELSGAERGLLMDLCYGVCRHYRLLDEWLARQLQKPIKASAHSIQLALLCGLYERWFTGRPAHAVVNAWPDVCRALKAPWAAGLCNAILRKAGNQLVLDYRATLPPAQAFSLPGWLWKRLQNAWPEQAATLAESLCDSAPLTVRLRPRGASETEAALRDAGLTVTACRFAEYGRQLFPAFAAHALPGFAEGRLSIQDEAAQLPAALIEAPAQARLLDACAAPGGKTGQLAERFADARIIALDIDARRLKQIEENMARLGAQVEVRQGDASQPDGWWDGEAFDAVLLDAPCSATGIMRRQPDVKWHRRDADITALCGLQSRMLDAIWPLIKPGGMLVYATCSVLPEENASQVEQFLARTADAVEDTPRDACSVVTTVGCQLLPQPGGHDGFFFARLRKG